MNKIIKLKSIALLAICLAVSVLAGVFLLNSGIHKANASVNVDLGAEIRTDDPQGIRFTASFNQTVYDECFDAEGNAKSGKTLGMIVAPLDYYKDFETYKKSNASYTGTFYEYFKDIKGKLLYAEYKSQNVIDNGSGDYSIRLAISNVKFNNVDLEYMAVGFVKTVDGATETFNYGDYDFNNSRSMAFIAAKAIQDGVEAVGEYIDNYIYKTEGVSYNSDENKYYYNAVAYDSLSEIVAIDLEAKKSIYTPSYVAGLKKVKIVDGGLSDYSITISASASAEERTAADYLQSYLKTATGVQLPIVNESATDKYCIAVGNTSYANKPDVSALQNGLYEIKKVDEKIFLCGKDDNGTLAAVKDYLASSIELYTDENGKEFFETLSVLSAEISDKRVVDSLTCGNLDKKENSSIVNLSGVDGITEILYNGKSIDCAISGSSVTFEKADIAEVPYGDRTLYAKTAEGYVAFTAKVADKVIMTNADFLNMFDYLDYNGNVADHVVSFTGYIVLGADLDFSSMAYNDYERNYYDSRDPEPYQKKGFGFLGYSEFANVAGDTLTAKYNEIGLYTSKLTNRYYYSHLRGFVGTLDGAGHTVKGLTVGPRGIFPSVGTASVIKNIAFVESNIAWEGYFLASCFYGTLDNVLIDISGMPSTDNAGAGVAQFFGGKITNSIIRIATLPKKDNSYALIARNNSIENNGTITSSYAIGSVDNSYAYGTTSTDYSFNGDDAFNAATKNYDGFDSDIWNFTDYNVPVFKTYNGTNIPKVVKQRFSGNIDKKETTSTITLEGVTSVSKLTLGGNDISYSFNDGTLIITKATASGISNGTQKLYAETDKGYTEITATVADKVIMTNAEFLNMFDYLDYNGNVADHVVSFTGDIALGADLDFSSMTYNDYERNYYDSRDPEPYQKKGFGFLGYSELANVAGDTLTAKYNEIGLYTSKLTGSNYYSHLRGFVGTLDGAGHTVKGLTVGPLGIFPSVGTNSVIKNIAFVDSKIAWEGYFLGNCFYGKLDNVLIDISGMPSTDNAGAGVCRIFGGTITNSIIRIAALPKKDSNYALISKNNTIENNGTITNSYAIGSADNSYAYGTTSTDYAFNCDDAFIASAKNYDGFDSDIWNFTEYVIPVFKTYNGTNIAKK